MRRSWNRHPLKIAFLRSVRKQIPNPNTSSAKRFPTVWGADCACCGGTFALSGGKAEGKKATKIQVDHKVPAGSFIHVRDIQGFYERLMCVGLDDLQAVCDVCNKTLSLGERLGVSFNRAKAEREAIDIVKAKTDKEWLEQHRVTPAKAQANRRKQIADILEEEYETVSDRISS